MVGLQEGKQVLDSCALDQWAGAGLYLSALECLFELIWISSDKVQVTYAFPPSPDLSEPGHVCHPYGGQVVVGLDRQELVQAALGLEQEPQVVLVDLAGCECGSLFECIDHECTYHVLDLFRLKMFLITFDSEPNILRI